jgi:LysM repeat protein
MAFLKYKTGIVFSLLLLLCSSAQAYSPDSLRVRWINGKKFVLHKVAPKETYSSLSRRYKVTIADLQKANPGVEVLKIGQIVNVPVVSSSDVEPTAEEPVRTVAPPKQKTHRVAKGETLFRIAKMYGMTLDELKELNGISGSNVGIGQVLKVRNAGEDNATIPDSKPVDIPVVQPAKAEPKAVPPTRKADEPAPLVKVAPVEPGPKTDTATAPTELPKVYSNPGTSRTVVEEKDAKSGTVVDRITEVGVASWMAETDVNQSKFYALHRTAPVGTIIKVTNRMNNNSVFVKVVGPLPDTGDNDGVIIKITQAAAQRIGAIDQKFTAELSYGVTK